MADTLPSSSAPSAPVTEAAYQKLRATLESLFELDKADLDFGIYRLMAARNAEVQAFLDRQLKDVVRKELGSEADTDAARLEAQLNEEVARLTADGLDPEQSKKVQQLRKRWADSGSVEELEGRVYGHLSAFFSRYYDGGDFISQRRYGKDQYAIPYDGREVVLHWANKDQHYIKSGESHRNYAFRAGPNAKLQIRFTVVDAAAPRDNNKEAANAKRQHVLADDPVSVEGDVVTVRFEHRPPTEAEAAAADDGAVAIFGGKYATTTKGDVRERFAALAEARLLAALPAGPAKSALTAADPTDAKPDRTLLGRHLDKYGALNKYDYFIHKDLRGFLTRELDHYLKSEVLNLDDVVDANPDDLARVQGRLRATRKVATAVIDFVSGIEEFQKKLWLKKKLVLSSRWLVSLRLVESDALRERVAGCEAVWAHWEKLGFRPDEGDGDADGWGTRAWLDAHDGLVLDTGVIEAADPGWTGDFLAGVDDVDEATTGTLVHGENFNALTLLEERYRGEVKCVYLDPPYNTDAAPINYKNGYQKSSWAAMVFGAVQVTIPLLRVDAMLCVTIDDAEVDTLRSGMLDVVGTRQFVGQVTIKNNPAGRTATRGFSLSHEYAIFYGENQNAYVGRLPHSDSQKSRYKERDEIGFFEWTNFRKHGGGNTFRTERPKQFYPIYVAGDRIRIPKLNWDDEKREYEILEDPEAGEAVLLPIDAKSRERIWDFGIKTARKEIENLRVKKDSKGEAAVYRKWRINTGGRLPLTTWDESQYSAAEYGTNLLAKLFGRTQVFVFPKSVHAVEDCVRVTQGEAVDPVVLDYFAGSGTTAHAVINLNREDNGTRKFLLVEMGEYFETVLVPRVMKVMYSPDWKDGRATKHDAPQPGLVKVFAIESYDDALENLPERDAEHTLLSGANPADEPLLRYLLDLEAGPRIADTAAFDRPWSATLRARNPHGDGTAERPVDLVETFNYLLGLRVRHHGRVRRYAADFEASAHPEGEGRLDVDGKLRRDDDGPFAFQRIEGELADGTRVLVVWRQLTGHAERDDAALRAHLADEAKREGDADTRPFQRVYVNGSCTLNQPAGGERRQFYSTEEAFHNAMFETAQAEAAERG